MNFDWKSILNPLITAAASGAATALVQSVSDPQHVDLNHIGPMVGIGALVGIANLFRQTPNQPPPDDPPKNNTTQFPQTK